MLSFSRTTLCGELMEDPVVNTTQSGKQVAKLRVATSEEFNGNVTKDFHTVTAWDRLALQVSGLRKGAVVYVEGKNKTRSYENKDGVKQWSTEVNATVIKSDSAATQAPRQAASAAPGPTSYLGPVMSSDIGHMDDIPF